MRLETCYYCSSTVWPGHGIQFVRNDCKIFRFCRSRCHRAFKKKWNPRKSKWTKAHRKFAGKDLTTDATFEFEKRRNEPVKYSRELWENTYEAIEKIEKIRTKRERHHIMKRLRQGTLDRKAADLREVRDYIHLVRAPNATKPMEEIEMVQKAIAKREEAGELLTKVGTTVATTKKLSALRRRAPKIEVTMETSDTEQMVAEVME
ncbi:unnamed protein product [Rotaria magnacalcarata]|uniref:Probable ribosome biogenesis protein RLP24 n=1 Tax=Rotaria magnacalcarata TaxID=392030 RepID=A0A819PBS1_9BILA|nr:unnamed protein product [Rotaria magnacalcarata]CAF1460382.1 unnamed protein product [Rotaria magnacalcarata]CAF1922909.1 unnamed protein product [Rotaria magnacalcarata]CAF1995538.1 unnamed protein product [Rotaria magnacalcarata]CAF2199589.1 unnamed protein product [Rotaria magnacalcarata]